MWTETEKGLYRKFIFLDFDHAFRFMMQVAAIAEAQNHHPNWSNVYNVVEICLNTHDAGGSITEKDRLLAASIDEVTI